LTQEQKNEELYKASLSAFFQNELEHDKIILGLSTAGIGFFIAIFQTQKGNVSELMFISAIVALVMFAITVLMILAIFIYNKKQIISIIKNTGKSDEIKELTILDKTKYIPFAIAIVASMIFTLSLVFQSINKENIKMKDKTKSNVTRDINSFRCNYEKRGFSEVSTANTSETNSSNTTTDSQVNEGFTKVSSPNQGDKNDTNISTNKE